MKAAIAAIVLAWLVIVPAQADSLFTKTTAQKGTLIAKNNLFEVGDVVTVSVKEKIASSAAADTNTKKESDVEAEADAGDNTFLVAPKPDGFGIMSPEKLPNWDLSGANETKAKGQIRRESELNATVTCIVTAVLDNGLLAIEGTKTVNVSREESRLYVSGLVRARDITPANTVMSSQLANAVIELTGKGPLWNNQRRGLVTRALDWVWPF